MLKNIVFDMGGVIIEWNPHNLSQRISPDKAWVLEKYIFGTPVWAKLDAGSVSLEDGLKEILDICPKEYHALVTYAFYHWGEYNIIFEDTETFIKKLKDKGYQVYLLSNAGVIFDDYQGLYPVFDLIDYKYISAHHRLTKPNKEIYLDFLNLYGLKAEECLFIDDLEANVLGARSVGMQGYHFKGDTSELEEMLL